MIRKAKLDDAKAICAIYNHYIENSIITFEEEPVTITEMKDRIRETRLKFPWIVYENNQGEILGYAYATRWKSRSAYQYSVESSLYIEKEHTGQGIGFKLYEELINKLIALGHHAMIGGIAIPNEHSIKLHEKFGFEKVAHFNQVGKKFDKWIDVEYWELALDKYASLVTTPA
ncbi:MAG: N-acetyltransferase [Gammaproteobacteria bacterium]|nr:MAG: N-acetyltransferase [Gammaproteobacteria bacterium]